MSSKNRIDLTGIQRALIMVVVFGAVVIAGIGFAGSYAAVRDLAQEKGFGRFSAYLPIGIDAGIAVLLALDLLLTWLHMPFPLLRQCAWLLTVATIAFNAAAAWPDPIGVGMHAVIPVLFVVTVEAARHAIGRFAAITADRHIDSVRLVRWILAPLPTFVLWRKMRLWEMRSYEQVVGMEQDRLIYQARLQARYGRGWRRKAPVEALVPVRLARIGVPVSETAPAGLAAAGIAPLMLPPADSSPEDRLGEESRKSARAQDDSRPPEHPKAELPPPSAGAAQHPRLGRRDKTVPPATPPAVPHPAPDPPKQPLASPVEERPPAEEQPQEGTGRPPPPRQTGEAAAHRTAVDTAKTKADAIRYALKANPGAEDKFIVTWLAGFGREVNRGQVYRVKQQRERPSSPASPPSSTP